MLSRAEHLGCSTTARYCLPQTGPVLASTHGLRHPLQEVAAGLKLVYTTAQLDTLPIMAAALALANGTEG